jgi:hypothetical protein
VRACLYQCWRFLFITHAIHKQGEEGLLELSSAVMADILKAQVGSVEVIRHLVAGRCDDFPALPSKVFKFLAREKDLSMRPGGALGLPSRCDPRQTQEGVVCGLCPGPPSFKSLGSTPSPSASARISSASSPSLRSGGVARPKHFTPPSAKKAVSLSILHVKKKTMSVTDCGLRDASVQLEGFVI